MAPPLSPSVLLGQARATFERLRTPNAGSLRTENPLRDSRKYRLVKKPGSRVCSLVSRAVLQLASS
jgi:hypothetical protein